MPYFINECGLGAYLPFNRSGRIAGMEPDLWLPFQQAALPRALGQYFSPIPLRLEG